MPATIQSIAQTMLDRAVERALREWLFELGHENVAIRANADGTPDIYHLPGVRRVVLARAAVAPAHPHAASGGEIRTLRELTRRYGADPWEARVVVRSNYHPSAILWRRIAA